MGQKTELNILWKEINLLGCISVLQELYEKNMIRGNGFLYIEIGISVIILIEISVIALAFAYATNAIKADYEITSQADSIH